MKIPETIPFINKEYKEEWLEGVRGFEGKVRYCEGTYILLENGIKIVYDGATNYIGMVKPDGTLVPDSDEENEYEMTFLRAARDS